jgi:hypothetical protein
VFLSSSAKNILNWNLEPKSWNQIQNVGWKFVNSIYAIIFNPFICAENLYLASDTQYIVHVFVNYVFFYSQMDIIVWVLSPDSFVTSIISQHLYVHVREKTWNSHKIQYNHKKCKFSLPLVILHWCTPEGKYLEIDFFLPRCSRFLEHRAEFPQFLDQGQSVGLLGRVISSSQGPYLYTNTEKRTHIHKH